MFDKLVEKLKTEKLAPSILSTIATMTLPFSRQQFLQIFNLVYEQGDNEIRSHIVDSFSQIDNEEIEEFINSTSDSKVLLFYYDLIKTHFEKDKIRLLVSILRNKNCSEEIFFRASSSSTQFVHEYLVNNQTLLQENPIILDLLLDNEDLIESNREKLREYVKFGIVRGTSIDSQYEVKEKPVTKPKVEESETIKEVEEVEEVEEQKEEVEEDKEATQFIEGEDEKSELLVDEEFINELDEEELSLYQKILNMSVSKKIDRALKGTKEERTLLIRDSNKMVAKAVINSPKLTDQEAEGIAAMRNVHRDILREMCQNRKFVKKYKIVLNLVKNPKTPQDLVLRMLPRLIDRDIKLILKDKALPEFLRKNALRISKTRSKR